MRRIIAITLFATAVLLSSCGVFKPGVKNKDKLSHLELDFTKEGVREVLGEPDEVRGSLKNEDGDTVTVWEYLLFPDGTGAANFAWGLFLVTITWWIPDAFPPYSDAYWLYFVENTLVRWGRAGDWEPDVIQQIKLDVN